MNFGQETQDYLISEREEYRFVDKLVNIRMTAGTPQVAVCYFGFGDEDPAWIPVSELRKDVS